jgi:dephospho-CoA kinase
VTAVLITGMSGTGKSTVIRELARRGFAAVDTDDGGYIELVAVEGRTEPEPMWREDRITALFDQDHGGLLFLSGTVVNQGRFYPRLDAVVLLSAPLEVVLDRVRYRIGNPFGQRVEERNKIAEDLRSIEPVLRARATIEIDTRGPVEAVIERVLALAKCGTTVDRQ